MDSIRPAQPLVSSSEQRTWIELKSTKKNSPPTRNVFDQFVEWTKDGETFRRWFGELSQVWNKSDDEARRSTALRILFVFLSTDSRSCLSDGQHAIRFQLCWKLSKTIFPLVETFCNSAFVDHQSVEFIVRSEIAVGLGRTTHRAAFTVVIEPLQNFKHVSNDQVDVSHFQIWKWTCTIDNKCVNQMEFLSVFSICSPKTNENEKILMR